MRRLLLLLSACTASPVQLPPPGALTLTAPTYGIAGTPLTLQVDGTPRAIWGVAASSATGPGSCPPGLAPSCLDIADPLTVLTSGRLPASGSRTLTLPIPSDLEGSFALQAASVGAGVVEISEVADLRVYSPVADADGDGLLDVDEVTVHSTDPDNPDTDGDTLSDGDEVADGTDPNVPDEIVVLSDDLLDYAMDVAEDGSLWDGPHAVSLLEGYRARRPRRLSEPQYISDLSFVWLLLKDDLVAEQDARTQFCETYLTRLSLLLTEGEIFDAPGADPGAILSGLSAPGAPSPWNGQTRNNRHAREAGALAIAAMIIADAEDSIPGCYGVDLSDLFAPGSTLDTTRIDAMDELFVPTGSYNTFKYSPITTDGGYKEGPGYLEFTLQVLMPWVFFYDHYEGVNLFADSGEFTPEVPQRLRTLFDWFRATQDDDGQWPSIEDGSRITLGRTFAASVGVYMMRHLSQSVPDLRKNNCSMLGRANGFLYADDLIAACAEGDPPFQSCTNPNHVRLAGLLFAPNIAATSALHASYGIAVPEQCGAYYRQGTPQYRAGPTSAHYPVAGQAYLASRDAHGLQVRLSNNGSWWDRPGNEMFEGYDNGTVYNSHAACDAAFPDTTSAVHRDCHHVVDLRAWFSTSNAPLAWHPRTANHKRYNDSHLELRAYGRDLLIGSGQMNYTSSPFPYEEWNAPTQYNLTRTMRRWPKTLYLQGDVDEKMELLASRSGCGELYRMRTDTYDRYVLWAHERYLVVTDRVRSGSPLYMQTSFHIRGRRTYLNTPSGRLNATYAYLDKTQTGTELLRDDNTRLSLRSVIGGLEIVEDVARDSCQGDTFAQHESEGFCEHSVIRLNTHQARPQKMMSFVLWPYQGSDTPQVSFSNLVATGDTVEQVDVHIAGTGVDDVWTLSASSPETMLNGVCGP